MQTKVMLGASGLALGVALLFTLSQQGSRTRNESVPLRGDLASRDRMTAHVDPSNLRKAVLMYAELTGRQPWPDQRPPMERIDAFVGGRLSRNGIVRRRAVPDTGINVHRDGLWTASEVKQQVEAVFDAGGLKARPRGRDHFELVPAALPAAQRQ